jgi:uncharacterized protein involved in exopolysaccharide biosynthesis
MRPVARILIRLYPANWRVRYGEGFESLLDDCPPRWPGIFDLVKGAVKMQLSVPAFPKLAFMLSITGLLAGLAISFVVDPRYVSTATMTLGGSLVNSPSPGVRPNLREYFAQMQNEILSRTSLSTIIQDPNLELYMSERAKIPLEDVIEKMRKDTPITIEAPGSNYLVVRITFAYPDPIKARNTVQALIAKFIENNLVRQRAAYAKRERSYDQFDRMEARIAALEKRLGMPPAPPEPLDQFAPVASGGVVMKLLDPPSLSTAPVYPDRFRFMAAGFGAGLAAAVVIAISRRRPPPIPFPAQTA